MRARQSNWSRKAKMLHYISRLLEYSNVLAYKMSEGDFSQPPTTVTTTTSSTTTTTTTIDPGIGEMIVGSTFIVR